MSNNQNDVAANQAAVGYFVDQKKGEVNELKQLLKNINVERDPKRKREIIKKVIAYMTLGIDVSRLFTDMIMAIETKDIVVKKMVYLYLCNYAVKEPDLAIMCINSLRRDCDNEDPLVRGLALRSLCNLRLESILEYIEKPLQKSLTDVSAYVRKTGVLGILKVNVLSPALIVTNNYLPQLYQMLSDVDANVVTNVIHAINELQLSSGGIEVTQTMVMNLLNRVGEFSEWGLNTILDIVARYSPSSDDEMFSIMNLLDPVLRTANSGAVLATLKCFLKLTEKLPELQPQVYLRSKPPMLTLITGAYPEGQFTVLKHLEIILRQPAAQGVFDDEFRQFFVRYNEPPHVKHLKVDLLPLIANETNARDISTELGEYVTDVDPELSKRAIRSIAEIALKIPLVAVEMTQILMELIYMDVSHIRSESAKVIANVIRVSPNISGLVLPHLSKLLKRVEDPDAKSALIWMLGEFGEHVIEAPYILESIIDNYNDESSEEIKLQVLSSAMKLFCKRPPEMQAMLGRLLNDAVNATTNQDLHDRALLYYRLLSTDINTAKAVFSGNKSCSIGDGNFAEKKDMERINKIFQEFNSLAVIYGMPSSKFIEEEYQLANRTESNIGSVIDVIQPITSAPPPVPVIQPHVNVGSVNLLDWDDTPAHVTPTQHTTVSSTSQLVLKDTADITPPKFQQLWSSFPEVFNTRLCSLSRFTDNPAELEACFRGQKIFTIASGPLPGNPSPGIKLFVYGAQPVDGLTGIDGPIFLIQLIILSNTLEVNVTLKSDCQQQSSIQLLLHTIVAALAPYQPRG
eukprot:gene5129-7145_t